MSTVIVRGKEPIYGLEAVDDINRSKQFFTYENARREKGRLTVARNMRGAGSRE